MANFNFGIDCEDEGKAEQLMNHIAAIDIYQDGLDFSDNRVSVISKTALLDELKKFAAENACDLTVEAWPEGEEYDDAETNGSLEVHQFQST